MTVEVRLFGAPELRWGNDPVSLASGRALLLLAYLVLHHDRPQPRAHLAFLLWPDSTEEQARTNLRHVLHTLRASNPFSDGSLRVTPRTLTWTGARSDVAAFEAAVEAGAAAPDADTAVKHLSAALDLYVSDLMVGSYDDWVLSERERLHRGACDAARRLVARLETRGCLGDAVRYAERLISLDPLAEENYVTLMRLHDLRGERARAVRVYHQCTATLERELGAEPGPGTQAAYEALLPPAGHRDRREAVAPLIGRRAERARLVEAWREAEGGGAQLVVVTGEPGVGKTRLVEEFRRWCAQRGAVTATARSYAVEGALAYAPVAEWLRAGQLARLRALDAGRLADLSRLLPELTSTVPAALPEDELRARLFDAAAQALVGTRVPLMLVADDAHWADPHTLAFVHYLMRAAAAPLLVTLTARLEETDDGHPLRSLITSLRALDRCVEVDLGALDPAETSQLAERITGRRWARAGLERLYAATEGNPLFVIEALRAGWEDVHESAVLTSKVHAVIDARLTQLSSGARELIGLAATIGRAFPVAVLARTRADDQAGFTADLDELWRRRLIRADGVDGYDFSHDSIREVAYRALRPAQRGRYHRLAASALQDVFSDDPDSAAAQIARHLDLAGNPEQAVTWYQRAADTAVRLHADADAVRMLERGIAVLRTAGPSFPSRLSRELDVLTALPGPLASAEGYLSPRLEAVHERALALGAKLGAEPTAPLLRSLALAALSRGDFGAARRAAEELTAKGGGDDVLAVEGAYVQGVAAFWLGELTAARACFETALERYRPEQRPAHLLRYAQDPQVVCLSRLAHTLWHLGDENGAARTVAEALARGRELGHPFTLSLALVFATMLAVESGNVDEVRTRLADLAAIGGDAPLTRLPTEAFAGYLTVVDGQVAEGLVRIESALADQERAAAPGLPALLQRTLLAAATVAGDAGRARRAAGELLAGNVRLWDTVARNAVTAQWNAGGTPGT